MPLHGNKTLEKEFKAYKTGLFEIATFIAAGPEYTHEEEARFKVVIEALKKEISVIKKEIYPAIIRDEKWLRSDDN